MPELPEVEHFKRLFSRTSTGKIIKEIIFYDKKVLLKSSTAHFKKVLLSKKFMRISRRGKFLLAKVTESDYTVIFHFGLTGFLAYAKDDTPQKYARIIFVFTHGDSLQFIDPRKFGHIYMVTDIDKIKTLKTMGPESVTVTKKEFDTILFNHPSANIKTLLMNQAIIAGIGNDYSNEILFASLINPRDTIDMLTAAQKKSLYMNIKKVLTKASHLIIHEREENFPKSWLLAHKKDMICPKNKNHHLKRVTIHGRTAIYCPEDQKR